MFCPACGKDEMAYSVLSNGLMCLNADCGFELEIDAAQAHQVLETQEELVCC